MSASSRCREQRRDTMSERGLLLGRAAEPESLVEVPGTASELRPAIEATAALAREHVALASDPRRHPSAGWSPSRERSRTVSMASREAELSTAGTWLTRPTKILDG